MLAFILRAKEGTTTFTFNGLRKTNRILCGIGLKLNQRNYVSCSTIIKSNRNLSSLNEKELNENSKKSTPTQRNEAFSKNPITNFKDKIAKFKVKALQNPQNDSEWSSLNSFKPNLIAFQTKKSLDNETAGSNNSVKPWLNKPRLLSRSGVNLTPLSTEAKETEIRSKTILQETKQVSPIKHKKVENEPNLSAIDLGNGAKSVGPKKQINYDLKNSSFFNETARFSRTDHEANRTFKQVSTNFIEASHNLEIKKIPDLLYKKEVFNQIGSEQKTEKQPSLTTLSKKEALPLSNESTTRKRRDVDFRTESKTYDLRRNQAVTTSPRNFTNNERATRPNFVPSDDQNFNKDRHAKTMKSRVAHQPFKLKAEGKKLQKIPDEENDIESPARVKAKKANIIPIKSKDVFLPPLVKVGDLAKLFNTTYDLVKRKMVECGLPEHPHSYLMKSDDAALVAMALNLNPIIEDNVTLKDLYQQEIPPLQPDGTPHPYRTPVVTIMGHVDHGKTTLLDKLRSANVAAGEAGGITQHIGAFRVSLNGSADRHITFLDTPGHAAFRQMRYRGANVTDIVVLVVAADDGIMPQTIEAINHTLEAKVPMIVAVTKCDKPTKDLNKIKESLLQHNVQLETFGGDTQVVELSAVTGQGIQELEEAIVTLAEILDLRAPTGDLGTGKNRFELRCEAVVLESSVDKGLGPVATVVVNSGTLRPGMLLVAGEAWCKVKGLVDDQGRQMKLALPGTPAQVSGWRALPDAGDVAIQANDEDEVKLVVNSRQRKKQMELDFKAVEFINDKRYQDHARLQQRAANPGVELEPELTLAAVPTLPIVIKGDVSGTIEAIEESINQLPSTKAIAKVIHRGVGPVTKADLDIAVAAQSGFILTFNVKTDKEVIQAARNGKVELCNHRIIYKLLEEVRTRLLELVPATYQYNKEAEAEVKQIFEMKLKGRGMVKIAGCRISKGTLKKDSLVTVSRLGGGRDGSDVVRERVAIATLKHFKEDVNSVKEGTECAIELKDFDNVKAGDKLVVFDKVELPKVL